MAASALLVAATAMAAPPSGIDQTADDHLSWIPGSAVLAVGTVAAVAWFVALVVASAADRRWRLIRDTVLAGLAAVGLVLVAHAGVGASSRGRWWPDALLAVATGVVVVTSPHLARPFRRAGTAVLVLGAVASLDTSSPLSTTVAGWSAGLAAAAAVHLAVGSVRGRPGPRDVEIALEQLGVAARLLGPATRQDAGVFVYDAVGDDGDGLIVKVYGRDAFDTRLLTTAWRRLWYRDAGPWFSGRRAAQVRHEVQLAERLVAAGILTDVPVAEGATRQRDAVVVLRRVGAPVADEGWEGGSIGRAWQLLAGLTTMGVAHGRVDDVHLVGVDGRVGIRDLRGATVAADEDERATDAGQLIVTTALAVGAEDALGEACAALGPAGLSRALAFVQTPALSPSLRRRVRAERYDLDELRREAGALPDVSVPELQRLRRVTWSSAIQVGLLVVAFTILWRAVSDIDLGTLVDELRGATWWLAVAGAVVAQTPRLAQAVSCLGAAPLPLALRPVYFLQLAQSYIGLAVPSSAARIAVNVRFFQRQGLAPGGALAVGAVDGLAGFVVQAMVLVGLLVFTPRSLDFDLSLAWGTGIGIVLVVAVVVGVVIAAVAVLRPGLRAQVVAWVRGLVADGIVTVRGLRSPKRLAMLLGGNLGSDLLFATALGLFARAFGTSVGLGDLLLIVISVALLAGLLPVPGGVGVTEGGLALGLVGAGMSEEAAFAAVISYRLCTFYVPPVWGFFALRWLERNQHL